jgi:hypothetical protein
MLFPIGCLQNFPPDGFLVMRILVIIAAYQNQVMIFILRDQTVK